VVGNEAFSKDEVAYLTQQIAELQLEVLRPRR
jgi:hypothetical protein